MEFVRSYASEKLESCRLFTSVYGYNFATYRMNSLEDVVLRCRKIRGGFYLMEGNGSITLYYKNENWQELISDCIMLATILHESIHHILRRPATRGTGMMFVINGNEIGRGLNEGLTEWIVKKAGLEPAGNETYGVLEKFIEQIEVAIGEENTMQLGKAEFQDYPQLMGISQEEFVTLMRKGDTVYLLGNMIAEKEKPTPEELRLYNQAICEFESTVLDLFFAREFEELKKGPIEQRVWSRLERLASVMSSGTAYAECSDMSEQYSSIRFLNAFNTEKVSQNLTKKGGDPTRFQPTVNLYVSYQQAKQRVACYISGNRGLSIGKEREN